MPRGAQMSPEARARIVAAWRDLDPQAPVIERHRVMRERFGLSPRAVREMVGDAAALVSERTKGTR